MHIPKEVKFIIEKLKKKKFEAFIVGGCVRDVLMEKEPKDWDVTTNAKPEEIQKIFPESFYENKFLTVTARTKSKKPELKEIEITTYRSEAKYTDNRHPDEVKYAKTLNEDLARRDFTVNAIAIGLKSEIRNPKSETNTKYQILNTKYVLIDPFEGQEDLKNKTIRSVGNPNDRFSEDALRMMRAVRLATILGFSAQGGSASGWKIEEKTAMAIQKNAKNLELISKERIRDEFLKIIMSEKAAEGIELLRTLGLLKYIIPELEEGFGVAQNKHHIYECYKHSLLSLKYAAEKDFNIYVRLAALFHDVAKPRTKRGEGQDSTFYGHEIAGARMTEKILERLKFSKNDTNKIVRLVRYHLFYYNAGEVGESSVRRLVSKVGPENMEELLQVRMADRIGSGVPKAEPYKLRHLKYVVERVSQDPISAKMLKVSGNDIMDVLKIQPGPKVGQILDILLGYVLSDPKKNKKDFLEKEIKKIADFPEKKILEMAKKSKEEKEEMEIKRDEMTKKRYWVT